MKILSDEDIRRQAAKQVPDAPDIFDGKATEASSIATCPEHGEVEIKHFPVCGKFFTNKKCPECAKVVLAERKLVIDDLTKKNELVRKAKSIQAAGVSERHADCTFSNYSIPSAGVKAEIAVRAFEGFSRGELSLIVTGSVGTGKTHLAASAVSARGGKGIKIVKMPELMREIKESWRKDSEWKESDVINFYSRIELLIIDEIGVQFASDTEKMVIFEIIDNRYQAMKKTALLSNVDIDTVQGLVGERVIDRLREDKAKLVVMDWESYRGKK